MTSIIRILIFTILTLHLSKGYTQSSTVSGGGVGKSNKGSMTYTIGGVFSEVTSGSSYSSYQPIQRPFEFYLINKVDTKNNFSVYPNPTKDLTFVVEKNFVNGVLVCVIMDLSGRILEKISSNSNKTQIDLSPYPAGTYFLNISKKNKNNSVYKVIKY